MAPTGFSSTFSRREHLLYCACAPLPALLFGWKLLPQNVSATAVISAPAQSSFPFHRLEAFPRGLLFNCALLKPVCVPFPALFLGLRLLLWDFPGDEPLQL